MKNRLFCCRYTAVTSRELIYISGDVWAEETSKRFPTETGVESTRRLKYETAPLISAKLFMWGKRRNAATDCEANGSPKASEQVVKCS